MTKGKKWTLRLLGVAALALLICLCLLGSTMARYTSTGDGSGTLKVALWDLETTTIDLDSTKLSPSNEEYSDSKERTHTSGDGAELVTLENKSDVSAEVTISLGDELKLTAADNFEWGTGFTEGGNQEANKYGASIMEGFGDKESGPTNFLNVVKQYGVITIELKDDGGTTIDENYPAQTITAGGSLKIYGDVVWTSVYENATGATENDYSTYGFSSWAEFSDAVDTILGMYYTEIHFEITWSADQASVLP